MDPFTAVRLVISYPLLVVAGLIWLIGFGGVWWMSPAGQRNGPAGWAALAGAGMLARGVSGIAGLWISDRIGFGLITSAISTGGQALLVFTAAAGAFWLLRRAWIGRQR